MKTILSRLSDEQAKKEVRYLPILAVAVTAVPLFMFGFLAIAAFAFSGRGILLTYHKGLANDRRLVWYRILFAVCTIVALFELIVFIGR